jgi:hypothetical protein
MDEDQTLKVNTTPCDTPATRPLLLYPFALPLITVPSHDTGKNPKVSLDARCQGRKKAVEEKGILEVGSLMGYLGEGRELYVALGS